MMFAVDESNSGWDENRRPFNCDLSLGYTSKSNGARYVEYGGWSTLINLCRLKTNAQVKSSFYAVVFIILNVSVGVFPIFELN